MTATVTPLLDAALEYARRGWYVLPCRIEGLKPDGKKDVRLPQSWPEISTLDPVVIADWYQPGSYWTGVGIDTGRSGLVVVDLDATHGNDGLSAWAELGGTVAAYANATPTGGLHLFFRADQDRPVKASAGELGPGIDTRGTTGMVFMPPTVYQLGVYRETPAADWENLTTVPDIVAERVPDHKRAVAGPPTAAHPAPAPGLATLRLPSGTPRYTTAEANRRITVALDVVRRTPEGGGFNHKLNDAAFEIGHWVAGEHLDIADAEALLSYVVTQVFPLGPNGDDLATIDSGLHAGMTTPYATFTPAAQAVLDSGTTVGGGFAKLACGSISNRAPVKPPTVYSPAGHSLFYESGIHWVFGESGSGKTWVALDAVARVLLAGGTALYLDYEDTVNSVLDRLSALGVDDNAVSRLAYVDGLNMEPGELISNLAYGEQFDISVLDGVSTSITEFGAASNDTDDVTRWANNIPRNMTGAVLCIDHVVKSKDDRGGYAIGSQAKKSVVTGASYEVVCDAPLRKGATGRLRLVLRKDKHGGVHVPVGDTAARLDFASSPDGLVMRVSPVSQASPETSPGPVDTQILLVAQVLETAHNAGQVNLEDGMRKLKDWITGHGHLADHGEATPMRAQKQEEAIRFARGWAGIPGVADRYRLKPFMSGSFPMPVSHDRGDAGGVSHDHGDVSQDHGDAGDANDQHAS